MIEAIVVGNTLRLVVAVGNAKKNYDITNLEGVALEKVMLEALDHNLWLQVCQETSLTDLLFKNGVPLYIQLRRDGGGLNKQFIMQLNRNPVTGEPFDRTITASASVGHYGIEAAFEVVWSKLVLVLGLLEVPGLFPLKCAALAHFKQQNLYGR